jgi:protein-tyrosine phosphatase
VTATDWQRVVALEGASNFRDLSGYRTADGRTIRTGKIYRSARLSELTPADVATLTALNIQTICDFRGEVEIESAPGRLGDPARMHRLTIQPTLGASLQDLLDTGVATGVAVRDLMRAVYRAYATDYAPRYRALFDLMVEEPNLPLLFHCSAGKDRAGFGAALLLRALGVPHDAVIEDYLLTNTHWRGASSLIHAPEEIRKVIAQADPDYLQAAFDAIDESTGSLEAYLAGPLGLDATRREKLRANLLA